MAVGRARRHPRFSSLRAASRRPVELHELHGHTVGVVDIEAAAAVRLASHDRTEVVAPVGRERSVDRIDVIGLSPKKHIAGFRPYAGEAENKSKPAWDRVILAVSIILFGWLTALLTLRVDLALA